MTQANGDELPGAANNHVALYSAALDASPHAQIVVDAAGAVALVNERARSLFNIGPSALGRPFQDLVLSYRPIELRKLIDQAVEQRRPVVLKEVEWETSERERRYLDVSATPLLDPVG